MISVYQEGECPEVRHKSAGDESYDICDLNGKLCLLEEGFCECEYFNDYLKEELNVKKNM